MGADAAAAEQFGPYLVYERLGVGGMATVHRALERGIEGFERIVALKRLLPHLAADATFIKSFVREAKLASLLNHVNIVQIFELGRVGTQYFISMEYIDGRDIRRILRHARKVSGPPPIHVTVGLLLQLCEALDYAHHKLDDTGLPMGLVHRDVSPSNVLVTTTGQVKMIDFGIAKAQSAQLRTQTGRVKGKLAYMAPEALAGRDLDARSDLFAAGVIAHELLTARPLFASKNEYQTLMKVQRGEVMPPSTFNQGCPPELDAIVLRTLARDPDDRFLHAGELRDELHAMRKQYGLQTSERDIATWIDWAFDLEASIGFTAHTDQPNTDLDAHIRHRGRTARPRRDDDDAVDLAWGGHDEQGSGEPIVLDEVPDVSGKHLMSPSALGADVRLDLDDLADDIPTPLPSHGKPTVDLHAARTTTTPMRGPRHRNRRPSAQPPSPTGDDATTPNAPVLPELRSVMPSRVRTITLPPRGMPAASAPPRNIAAAALPPRGASPAGEASRSVPIAAPVARSGAVAAEPSRRIGTATDPSSAIPVAIEPSYVGQLPREPSRAAQPAAAPPREPSRVAQLPTAPSTREPSRVAQLPTAPSTREPSRVAALPVEPSRAGMLPVPPVRSGPAAMPPPRTVPSSSVAPRERRPTSPGTGTPAPERLTPMSERITPTPDQLAGRDTLLDMTSTDRTPVFGLDELVNAADTMPVLPVMSTAAAAAIAKPAPQPSEAVIRFREPTSPPPLSPISAAQPAAAPPRDAEPPPDAPDATTSTQRKRLITPATALFAEPEVDTAVPTSPSGAARPSHATIPDPPPLVHRRVTLLRIALVVLCLAVVGAATAAAAMYLTHDEAPGVAPPPRPTSPPSAALGTVRFEVVPADAAISINGKRMHAGAPWAADLAPGVYQIEIERDGYMVWLTSVDVVAGQRQLVQVTLEALGSAVADATLVLHSTPSELDITVDSAPSGKTPRTLTLAPGRHTVALRAGGAEVWRREIDARGSVIYDYRPVIAPPGEGAAQPAAGSDAPPTAPAPGETAEPAAIDPSAPSAPGGPVSLPAGAVTRISGDPPRLTTAAGAVLPAEITAKLCIDDAGHVTGVGITTPLDPGLGAQIIAMLRTWQYEPYRSGGAAAAQPACFPVTFRAK